MGWDLIGGLVARPTAEQTHSDLEVVDLHTVQATELEELWQHEVGAWRDRLLWDISAIAAAFRRTLERGGIAGKVVRIGGRAVGFTYYAVTGQLGVVGGLVLSPVWGTVAAGEALLRETVDTVRRKGVRRIEAAFVSIDYPWLAPAFERQGFRTYWREFLRVALHAVPALEPPPAGVQLRPWRETSIAEIAQIMRAAYAGGIDAQAHQRYRTEHGCRAVLDDILHQGSCGNLVAEASVLAYHRSRGVGFIVTTEVASGQAHVAQVAVLPTYQRQGIGRSLLTYSMACLVEGRFDTLSLIVYQANDRALRLYRALGFHTVLAFPVFTWEA